MGARGERLAAAQQAVASAEAKHDAAMGEWKAADIVEQGAWASEAAVLFARRKVAAGEARLEPDQLRERLVRDLGGCAGREEIGFAVLWAIARSMDGGSTGLLDDCSPIGMSAVELRARAEELWDEGERAKFDLSEARRRLHDIEKEISKRGA
ncbi:hypothetical protein [Sphingomonas alba]|uniref:Uncharacterized protein n=1 Tax=Sphingomonas alba TaxID=2908208 RepID=A0ABT0RP99_9SPHN|nr:hypothetical protein [Sphingomonas alba]MCL6684453.1 hypothetical protein [Sphingomonas alba]